MVRNLARIKGGGELAHYNPERHRLTVAAIDYGIKEAKRIKDWASLEKAVDTKIEELQKFAAWWGVTIRSQGEARKKENRVRGFLSVRDAEQQTGMRQQRVSDLVKWLKQIEKFRQHMLGVEYRAAMLEVGNVRGTQGTGENEWHSPERYIELARGVLGAIDLDPASSKAAQKTVHAAQYFTKANDGLTQDWHGRVWLNPPYAQPAIAQFVSKMVEEWRGERVTAAIMLTHNYTDTAWFHEAASCAAAICFTRGRIGFVDPEGNVAAPTQGQAFFYFGQSVDAFASVFRDIGFIVEPLGVA